MNLPRLAQRGRRKSKDLEEQAMDLMGSQLEKVFKMMDIDGSGNLDEGELKRAYEIAGRPASDESIKKAIKMLVAQGCSETALAAEMRRNFSSVGSVRTCGTCTERTLIATARLGPDLCR